MAGYYLLHNWVVEGHCSGSPADLPDQEVTAQTALSLPTVPALLLKLPNQKPLSLLGVPSQSATVFARLRPAGLGYFRVWCASRVAINLGGFASQSPRQRGPGPLDPPLGQGHHQKRYQEHCQTKTTSCHSSLLGRFVLPDRWIRPICQIAGICYFAGSLDRPPLDD